MAKQGKVRVEMGPLKALEANLKATGHHRIQVGIFGDKTEREADESDTPTNAEVGAKHELGVPSEGLPIRSFLRYPLAAYGKELNKAAKEEAEDLAAGGRIEHFLSRIGIAAENIIQKAFDTGGWGNWAPLKYETIIRKLRGAVPSIGRRRQMAAEQIHEGATHAAILIETRQLRSAIASRVK